MTKHDDKLPDDDLVLKDIESIHKRSANGSEEKRLHIGTEDLVASFCGIIAITVLVGMLVGKISLSVGMPMIAAFASGSVISEIVKARRGHDK
jgi:hypothetical protein